MSLNRRAFLGSLLAGGVSAAAQPNFETPESFLFRQDAKKGFSILQGMTDERSAQFSLVLPKSTAWQITFERADGQASSLIVSSEIFTRPYSGQAAHRVSVDGLELGVLYLLRVINPDGKVWDEREFSALDISPRPVKLALISCLLDLLHRDDIWKKFEQQKAEAVLFLGDNVYADRTSFINKNPADEKQLWERYVLTRNRVALYYQRRLRPVIATWDDHDFGADNAYRDFPYSEESRVIFETFFAQAPRASLQAGPGIARRWSAFGADFVFLDGRTYRDNPAPAAVLGEQAKLLGVDQEQWLLAGATVGRPTWLINGSMFFGAYQTVENFEGSYVNDFRELLGKLAASPALYCFASGDVHFSEVMDIEPAKLGYKTFEIVSSSMHSYTFPGHENRFVNPRRRTATGSHNFVIFEGSFGANQITGSLTSYSSARQDFRAEIDVHR